MRAVKAGQARPVAVDDEEAVAAVATGRAVLTFEEQHAAVGRPCWASQRVEAMLCGQSSFVATVRIHDVEGPFSATLNDECNPPAVGRHVRCGAADSGREATAMRPVAVEHEDVPRAALCIARVALEDDPPAVGHPLDPAV